ncbi:DUF262 domain-containing protein [Geomicrobium sp. JSM 1781026]|uniref:DUF262 domain-containing protein n=1 Tax=Geomicrobium sp. JSM 1781026 TaxID=3344580 RepID=UPI0035C06B02
MKKPREVEELSVSKVFTTHEYVVPIYQRNYAWGQTEIELLLNDIDYFQVTSNTDNYFLGNLIVNKRKNDQLEVIDGQQRLTTLFILLTYLQLPRTNILEFQARKRSNYTLDVLEDTSKLRYGTYTEEIVQGYAMIENYFKTFSEKEKDHFKKKLDSVKLLQVQVPPDTDLNHYFEIMNNRGEQLELHEVAKGKLLSQLSSSEEEKRLAATIWDACANMNRYVQMNFDKSIRDWLFGSQWSTFTYNNFDELLVAFQSFEKQTQTNKRTQLLDILTTAKKPVQTNEAETIYESTRFESILSFPNFLLQVNALDHSEDEEQEEHLLNDQHLLSILSENFMSSTSAKKFIFNLLYARVVFDTFIIKREYSAKTQDDGKWSLQKLSKQNKYDAPKYNSTFARHQDQLRKLQSCLRVTYTSPRTMKWIHYTLLHLMQAASEQKNKLHNDLTEKLVSHLEQFCISRLERIDFAETTGFQIQRIAFTYLDYVLYRDNKGDHISSEWDFQFRNSIEHFFPQQPNGESNKWSEEDVHHFGNLALITVQDNSKFSNLPPTGKKESYKNVIEQSPKLKLMANLSKDWTPNQARIHGEEMIEILEAEIQRFR